MIKMEHGRSAFWHCERWLCPCQIKANSRSKKGKREEVFYFTVCYDDQADLIDKYQLMVHTVVLGSGKHRFRE